MSEATKKGLIPVLRFPEFRDAGMWKKTSLKKVFSIFQGYAFSSTDSTKEGVRWLKIADVGIQKMDASTPSYLPINYEDEYQRFLVKFGDYVIALTRPILSCELKIAKVDIIFDGALLNQRVGKLVTDQSLDFVYYLLQTGQLISNIENNIAGNDPPNLSSQQIGDILVRIPLQDEQQKIADCLSSIDELVTAQTQKIEALKAHKKGLMQQLFPAEGETIPKLRFPEFRDAGDWEAKKIGQVLIVNARSIKMDDEHDYSLVTVKRRYGGVVSRGVYKGGAIKVKSQFLLSANDFLISKRQIVHCACGIVPAEFEGSIVSNEYSVLRARKNHDIVFFNYFAQHPKVSQSFLECSIGIVIEKMLFKLNDWLNKEFLFPSFEEQQKIADCLSSIDDLVTAQTQKLATLKAHKKGLMQQLFPSVDLVTE